jgi:hypothetical protein
MGYVFLERDNRHNGAVRTVSVSPAVWSPPDDAMHVIDIDALRDILNDEEPHDEEEKAEFEGSTEMGDTDESDDCDSIADEHPSMQFDDPAPAPPKTRRLQLTTNSMLPRLHALVVNIVCRRRMTRAAGIVAWKILLDNELGQPACTEEATGGLFRHRNDIAKYIRQRVPCTTMGESVELFDDAVDDRCDRQVPYTSSKLAARTPNICQWRSTP